MSDDNNDNSDNNDSPTTGTDDDGWDTTACLCGDNLYATISRRGTNSATDSVNMLAAYIMMNGLSN